MQGFLALVDIVGLDDETARIFARERARLRAGNPIENFDLLIGATALRHDLTLLTNNRRHSERIQGLAIGVSLSGPQALCRHSARAPTPRPPPRALS